MQAKLLDVPPDVVIKIFTMLGATMIVSLAAVNKEINQLGAQAFQERLRDDKQRCVNAAGNYREANVRLFIELFHFMDILQSDQGDMVDNLPIERPQWMLSDVNIADASVSTEPHTLESFEYQLRMNNPDMVVACRNYTILEMAAEAIEKRVNHWVLVDLIKGFDISYCVSGMNKRLQNAPVVDSRLPVYMVPHKLPSTAIFVRRTPNTDPVNAINPVTLSFSIPDIEALQQVKGLLLLLGEARSNSSDCLKELIKLQEKFKGQDNRKADVELYFTWERDRPRSVLPASVAETVSMTEEWLVMREVFMKLEIFSHRDETHPVASCLWYEPQRTPIFRTLRIYEDYSARPPHGHEL